MRLPLLRLLSAAAIMLSAVLFISDFPNPTTETLDHHTYRVAVEGVRSGQSYYAAYEVGFRDVYGPIPAVRDVRPPIPYVALALVPSGSEHVAFAFMAVVAGLIPASFARFPPSGVLVTIYLLSLAVANNGAAQYLHAEFWIVPAVLGAVFAIDRGYDRTALGLGLIAFSVREQGLLLLLGVSAYLWTRPRNRTAVGIALGVGTVGYLLHVRALWPHLDTQSASHTPLHLGQNAIMSLMETVDFGLGIPGLGLLFLLGSFIWSQRHGLLIAVGPYLALPALALWVNRQYWGILVIPLAAVLTFDLLWETVIDRVHTRRRKIPAGA